MSSVTISPDFTNELHFPAFCDLPYEDDNDDRYYYKYGLTKLPWCLLAEIKGIIPWIRPMLRVQDKTGEEYLVAFHLADRSRYPAIAEKCKNGYTICVTYAEQHLFADGQIGVRVENEWGVKVLPCTLKELSNIGAKMSNQGVCNVCGASATLKCSRCKLFYCSKTCQNKDWSDAHKAECKVVQQVAQWVSDWNEYEKLKVLERTLGPLI